MTKKEREAFFKKVVAKPIRRLDWESGVLWPVSLNGEWLIGLDESGNRIKESVGDGFKTWDLIEYGEYAQGRPGAVEEPEPVPMPVDRKPTPEELFGLDARPSPELEPPKPEPVVEAPKPEPVVEPPVVQFKLDLPEPAPKSGGRVDLAQLFVLANPQRRFFESFVFVTIIFCAVFMTVFLASVHWGLI